MKDRKTDRITDAVCNVLLATAIGLIGAVLLGHYAACEQDDKVCMFTGSDAK